MRADAFLTSLGKDEGDDELPRRRRKKTPEAAAVTPAVPADPAPAETAPAADEAPGEAPVPEQPVTHGPTPVPAPVKDVLAAGPSARPRMPEPVHKTSVDLRWSLKIGLQTLVEQDRRGPKAELNDALEAWLKAKGIDIPLWEG